MIKKIAKRLLYSVPSSAVVMFHHITDSPTIKKSNCILSFEKFTCFIKNHNNYGDIYSILKEPSMKRIAITFDDGLKDLYELAYPFLKENNIPFTVFIVTDFLDQPGYMTKENLKEMAKDKLVTIGSHGTTHKNLDSLSPELQRAELEDSKKILERIIDKPVNIFAYSHGQYDQSTMKLMKKYKYGFSTRELPLNFFTRINKRCIPRFNVDANSYENALSELNKFLKE